MTEKQIERPAGIMEGLRYEDNNSGYRCDCCRQMQRPHSGLVYVPDGTLKSDPAWSVKEAIQSMRFNGNFSGWCLKCAPKEESPKATASLPPRAPQPASGAQVTIIIGLILAGFTALHFFAGVH